MSVEYQVQDVESYREAELRFKAVMEITTACLRVKISEP